MTTHNDTHPTITRTTVRPTAVERLQSIYRAPGPYVSAYLRCGELADTEPRTILATYEAALRSGGATEAALQALEARLTLPVPDYVSGWSIFCAADGATVADFAAEGSDPVFVVGALPMAAPLLEWDQWRVPHITVSATPAGSEIISFIPGAEPAIVPSGRDATDVAEHCRRLALEERLRLIVIGGDAPTVAGIASRLVGIVPPDCRVVELNERDSADADSFADSTVRYVADVVARDTVRALEDFRFLEAGGRTVQGASGAFAALASGQAEQLLLHDDPSGMALASFGAGPSEISADPASYGNQARRADVAIWSAVCQDVPVRVIPGTGSSGPDEDIAVTLGRTRPPVRARA